MSDAAARHGKTSPQYQPHIDGLRAVAVLAVILATSTYPAFAAARRRRRLLRHQRLPDHPAATFTAFDERAQWKPPAEAVGLPYVYIDKMALLCRRGTLESCAVEANCEPNVC